MITMANILQFEGGYLRAEYPMVTAFFIVIGIMFWLSFFFMKIKKVTFMRAMRLLVAPPDQEFYGLIFWFCSWVTLMELLSNPWRPLLVFFCEVCMIIVTCLKIKKDRETKNEVS